MTRLSTIFKTSAAVLLMTQAGAANALCLDPVEAVLSTLKCIEMKDAECASASYDENFVKLHNTVDTRTSAVGPTFWQGAFAFYDFDFDIDHVEEVGDNQVSIRYVETLTSRLALKFRQHEHALVAVTDDCRITLWDQYGDNAEQLGGGVALF